MTRYQAKVMEFKSRTEFIAELSSKLDEDLAQFIAWCHAVEMAYTERTGLSPVDGNVYIEDDERRADEILELFPEAGA